MVITGKAREGRGPAGCQPAGKPSAAVGDSATSSRSAVRLEAGPRAAEEVAEVHDQGRDAGTRRPLQTMRDQLRRRGPGPPPLDASQVRVHDPVLVHALDLVQLPLLQAIGALARVRDDLDGERWGAVEALGRELRAA